MKTILTLAVFLLASSTYAQTDTAAPVKHDDTVRVGAQFPDGVQGWAKYLQKSLHAEVGADNIALRRHQKDSLQTVIVSFLVDTAGNISEVKVENPTQVHPLVGAEAVRVIQHGPKWLPATINGKKVIYRQKQSIGFMVSQR
jgi:protein TonB